MGEGNEYLGAMRCGTFSIGYVEEVNGTGAQEVQEFLPTRHELLQLVKYWARVDVDIEYFYFCCQQSGSTEMRRSTFARRRLARIADLLGDEAVDQAIEEAFADYGKDQDPRVWNIFLNGTEEERKALREELDRKMQEYFAESATSEAGSGESDTIRGGMNEDSSELNR
jgi:hypothetical protein